MDILFGASIIAAFFAGMVALFAPCCITVLLPAYIASAFQGRKRILKMTLVFFAGISVVLIPIGLGAAWLASIFQSFHQEMYIFGGAFMIVLAILAVLGKGLALLPIPKKTLSAAGGMHAKSVFLLGIFSGAATSCCAPVLAGAVTLAVLSGVFWKALVVTFAYVFGMTFPLFVAAYFYDRYKLDQSRFIRGKILRVEVMSKKLYLHTTNLLAGGVFLLMGGVLVTLGFSGDAFWAPMLQTEVGEQLSLWFQRLVESLMLVPDLVWGILILGVFLGLLCKAVKES